MPAIKSIPRVKQRRVEVGAPVFQPAGSEEQRLFAEGAPVPKTTDADIDARVGRENIAFEDERYAKLKALTRMNREPQALSPRDPGYGAKDLKEPVDLSEEVPEGAMLNKEAKAAAMADIEQGGKPAESPEDAKAKFKVQLESAVQKGDVSPEEVQEIIKRLGR